MGNKNKSITSNLFTILISLSLGLLIGYFIFNNQSAEKSEIKPAEKTKVETLSNVEPKPAKKKIIQKDLGAIVAKIDGKAVYQSQVDKKLSAMVPGQPIDFNSLDDPIKQVIVKELAAEHLILERAYKQNFQDNENVLAALKDVKDGIIKEEFLKEMAKKKMTDAIIRTRYNNEVLSLGDKLQYKVSHILVKTKSEANEVRELLKTKKFSDVAKEKSIDKQTAEIGGDVGYMIDGVMVPDFESAVKKLKAGEISKPVKTRFGWHVIKLFRTIPVDVPEFELIKENISQMLYQEAINDYNEKISKNVKIELIDISKKQEDKPVKAEVK